MKYFTRPTQRVGRNLLKAHFFVCFKRRSLLRLYVAAVISIIIGGRVSFSRSPTISCFPLQNRLNQIIDRLSEGRYNFPYDALKLDDLTKLTNKDLLGEWHGYVRKGVPFRFTFLPQNNFLQEELDGEHIKLMGKYNVPLYSDR